jgi:hypothetical protein
MGRGQASVTGSAAVVYVPAGDHPATGSIAAASGIVGRPDGSGLTEIYFEGGIYDQVNMSSLADRVAHAYDRMATDYPTVAKMVVPQDALVAVGTFVPKEGRIELTGPDSEARVAAWLTDGDLRLDPTELLCRRGPS